MNVYDGDRMSELLDAQGMVATGEHEADLVVADLGARAGENFLNGCGVGGHAGKVDG